MEGKDGSYDDLASALAFYQRQAVDDSNELNKLREKMKRVIDAGNKLAASCDSGREIAGWMDAIVERQADRELQR